MSERASSECVNEVERDKETERQINREADIETDRVTSTYLRVAVGGDFWGSVRRGPFGPPKNGCNIS